VSVPHDQESPLLAKAARSGAPPQHQA
jgi:hypothetical protein